MFFPIGDENPSRSPPVITWSLIAINVLVFVLVNVPVAISGGEFGLADLFGRFGFDAREPLSPRLLSALFLHAEPLHLLGNMWVLWIVGDNVEDKLGRGRYLALYLVGGVVASWAFVIGALTMPVCCLVLAHSPNAKPHTLFAVPVTALVTGAVSTLWMLVKL